MSVNRDPLFFRFVNRARDPPVRSSLNSPLVGLNVQILKRSGTLKN